MLLRLTVALIHLAVALVYGSSVLLYLPAKLHNLNGPEILKLRKLKQLRVAAPEISVINSKDKPAVIKIRLKRTVSSARRCGAVKLLVFLLVLLSQFKVSFNILNGSLLPAVVNEPSFCLQSEQSCPSESFF